MGGLSGVGLTPNPDYAATIPHQTFMFYQLMFATITPVLMTGAFAGRILLKAVMGLRVTRQEERRGLDLSQHSESAYVFENNFDEVISAISAHGSEQVPSGAQVRSQNA